MTDRELEIKDAILQLAFEMIHTLGVAGIGLDDDDFTEEEVMKVLNEMEEAQ